MTAGKPTDLEIQYAMFLVMLYGVFTIWKVPRVFSTVLNFRKRSILPERVWNILTLTSSCSKHPHPLPSPFSLLPSPTPFPSPFKHFLLEKVGMGCVCVCVCVGGGEELGVFFIFLIFCSKHRL